jgi:hypothetical protein
MPPRISGYDINKLPAIYKGAVNTYLANGAVKVSRLSVGIAWWGSVGSQATLESWPS